VERFIHIGSRIINLDQVCQIERTEHPKGTDEAADSPFSITVSLTNRAMIRFRGEEAKEAWAHLCDFEARSCIGDEARTQRDEPPSPVLG
jgi:hypothetical protein